MPRRLTDVCVALLQTCGDTASIGRVVHTIQKCKRRLQSVTVHFKFLCKERASSLYHLRVEATISAPSAQEALLRAKRRGVCDSECYTIDDDVLTETDLRRSHPAFAYRFDVECVLKRDWRDVSGVRLDPSQSLHSPTSCNAESAHDPSMDGSMSRCPCSCQRYSA